jgi:hypothetical protein
MHTCMHALSVWGPDTPLYDRRALLQAVYELLDLPERGPEVLEEGGKVGLTWMD